MLVALLLAFGLLLARAGAAPFQRNFVHLVVANAFSSRFSSAISIDLLGTALEIDCAENAADDCFLGPTPTDEEVLRAADGRFLNATIPMIVVSESATIPIGQFVQSGQPDSLRDVDAPGTLYGPGYFELRLFLMAEAEGCWQISVKAKHDDPPPVELELWLDKDKVGTLSYGLGDQSWQTLSLSTPVDPNLHLLRIWFANDYLDTENGVDRNAYVETVDVRRLEDAVCENG